MRVSLIRTEKIANAEINKLDRILADMPQTAASRYALSEIILIRASAILESSLADLAYKITCGATFRNNRQDLCLATSVSLHGARQLMLTKNGSLTPPRQFLRWTRASYIKESIDGVIDPRSHYLATIQLYGSTILEIFEVRPHVAHRNASSRRKFQKWVKQVYGQERPIPAGYFLLTKNFSTTSNLERYLKSIPIVIREIVAGS